MQKIIREFLEVVDLYYGTYLDGITAFAALIEEIDETERTMQAQRPDIPPEAFADAPFNYSTSDPRLPNSVHLHGCTLGAYRERNTPGGRNHKTLGQMFVVTIYGFWEDHFRSALASALGSGDKNIILCDTMGDLGYLRNAIVNHRGIGTDKLAKCKVFRWFKEGDELSFTPEQMAVVVARLKNGLPDELRTLAAKMNK